MSSEATPVSDEDHAELPVEDSEAAAVVSAALQPESEVQPDESLWARLRKALMPGTRPERQRRRLEILDGGILANPNAPTGYVLRGELYLDMAEYELALADFQTAQKLASEQLAVDNWGILSQAMRDRALMGLEKASRKLGKRS